MLRSLEKLVAKILLGEFSDRHLFSIGIFCLLGIAAGCITFYEPFRWEFGRLRPFAIMLQFASELVALFWFTFYIATRFASPRIDGQRRQSINAIFVLVTVAAGIAVDLGVGLAMRYHDRIAHHRSVSIKADVVRYRWRGDDRAARHYLYFSYQPPNHPIVYGRMECGEDQGKVERWMPGEASTALIARRSPLTVDMLYDPDYPRKYWCDGKPWATEDSVLLLFSCSCLFFQFLASLLCLEKANRKSGIATLLPFIGTATCCYLLSFALLLARMIVPGPFIL